MMRWKQVVVCLAVTFAAISGCKQQCFLYECDYQHYQDIGLPASVECDPKSDIPPIAHNIPAPPTILDPDRPPRFLSLAETIAMALEQGRIGSSNVQTLSLGVVPSAESNLVLSPQHAGGTTQTFDNLTPAIRVLAMDPARVGTDIESSLSKFDAQWVSSMFWNNTDNAISGQFLNQFQPNSSAAIFRTGLLKPLPTGGIAGITFDTDYRLLGTPQATVPNPSYNTNLQFQFEQPLLQGYGIEINQIRQQFPTPGGNPTSLASFLGQSTNAEGILVTRIRFDQQRADFENNVQIMVTVVKHAYWNLYGAYWALYAQEQALRQAFEAWKINKARFEAGRIAVQDFAQTRQQYEQFRSQRLSALGQVLENERALRELIGLPVEDCTRLIPIDEPVLTPYAPDWCTALNECMALRPPLVVQREELKAKLFDVMLRKNNILPDLRAFATYGLNGIGSRLDGPSDDTNAFRNLASDRFTNWSLGLRLQLPIGYRAQHADLRKSRLALAQQYAILREEEDRAQHFLAQEFRAIFEAHAQIEINRSQRIAAAEQLEARFKQYLAGQGTLDILLESQRVWANALQSEYQAVVLYNNALVSFEFAKGTVLQDENVHIAEGPLPCCAQERAVDHLKERTKALVLRQRAAPTTNCCGNGCGAVSPVPSHEAPPVSTLPFLQQNPPSLPQSEALPRPQSNQSSSVIDDLLKTAPPVTKAPADAGGVSDTMQIAPIVPLPANSITNTLPGISGTRPGGVKESDKPLGTLPPPWPDGR
jgi:outer membrane protein TolC